MDVKASSDNGSSYGGVPRIRVQNGTPVWVDPCFEKTPATVKPMFTLADVIDIEQAVTDGEEVMPPPSAEAD